MTKGENEDKHVDFSDIRAGRINVDQSIGPQKGGKVTGVEFEFVGRDRIDWGESSILAMRLNELVDYIDRSFDGRPEQREELKQLLAELAKVVEQAPEEQVDETEKVVKRVVALVSEAVADNPDEEMVGITGESLKRAAENVKESLPTVLPIATQIVSHVLSMIR